MYELTRSEFSLAAPLFAEIPHHRMIVFSVLDGSCPGRVFVDDRTTPQTAFVSSVTEFLFFAGDAYNAKFNRAIREEVIPGLIKEMQAIALSGPSAVWQQAIDEILANYPGGWAQRAEFDFPPEHFSRLRDWRRRIPEGLRVETYNREIAARYEELEPFWNGIDNFLARGAGFYIASGAEVLSHCHTVVIGDGLAEISVETDPNWRRKGLAELVVSAFVEHCLRVGLKPHWTCWGNNQPSVGLAEKLGFVRSADAPVRYVEPGG